MAIRLGFVVSEFNRDLTYQMELLGREHATFLGAEVARTVMVPGVYDMPLAIKKLVSDEGRKIMDLSLESGKPVTLGISGPKMTRMEAHQRVDYAKRAVEAAVKMVSRIGE